MSIVKNGVCTITESKNLRKPAVVRQMVFNF